MTWNHGYNTDLGYTYGYYREQSPVWIDLCAAFHGSRPRGTAGEARRYLELGCGQGVNLCLIAALHPQAEFVGIDFNPHHIAHAQQLARAAGLANVRFLEGDFLQLAQDPTSLGVFDWITAHGIVSWIPPAVHAALAKLVGACLQPGGVYYTSYNTLPGWLSAMPIQHLLRLWQVREGLASLTAIDQGRERLLALIEAKAAMAQALPTLRARLEKFPQQAKNYLVQEYLHDNWFPFWFDEMHAALSPHKLEFLGSATAGEWYLPAMLPEAFKQVLAAYPDPVERQVMLDVLVNQSFRRDLWVKGKDPLWPGEQRPRLLEARLVLLSLPPAPQAGEEAKRFAYQTAIGEVVGKPEVYAPLYEALQSGPKSIAELIKAGGQNLPSTLQAVSLMLHAGHAAPYAPPKDTRPAQALNRALAQAVAHGAPYNYLVAPAGGYVITASDTQLMLLAAWQRTKGAAQPEALGEALAQNLAALGKGLKEGEQPLTTVEAMRPKAQALAAEFLNNTLPNWKRLGVVS
jgi:SAM-dependent methyltransferase